MVLLILFVSVLFYYLVSLSSLTSPCKQEGQILQESDLFDWQRYHKTKTSLEVRY